MIALTKSGYKKFIEGTLNLPDDVKVAVISDGITNSQFTTTNVNTRRSAANTNLPEYPIDDFSVTYDGSSNSILIEGQVNIDTMDFIEGGDTAVGQHAPVIDTTDSDDVVGMISLYPSDSPITYSALNSSPVNIDYRINGMAKIQLKTSYGSYMNYIQTSTTRNYTDIFPNGFMKMPIFDNTVTSNMLTDLKIALLSSNISNETTFKQTLYDHSKTFSTLDDIDTNNNYHYISGGFTFRNLGIASTYSCLSATDSTIYIPGLTINDPKVFAVVYFEDTSTAGNDVMSTTYKQNSYLLSTVHNINTISNDSIRFPFKQSVIIDSYLPLPYTASGNYKQPGILALNNVVGPGFTRSNINGDLND